MSNKRIRKTQVVDRATGEVIEERSEVFYQSPRYEEGRGYRVLKSREVVVGSIHKSTLSLFEKGFLIAITAYMDKDNLLDPLSRIAKGEQMSVRRVQQLLKVLADKEAVKKHDGLWYVNPALLFGGVYLSPKLYRLFQTHVKGMIPKWAYDKFESEVDANG